MAEHLVANVDDLSDGEMKEVSLGSSGKALLSRIDGQFYATSHLCPHYKAPLSKGTITTDGRVMCPWHGACFRVQSGDIEDAPSIDGLASFKVIVRDDKVYVKTTPEEVKVGRKPPVVRKFRVSGSRAVIVGGGAGGLIAAETLRSEGFNGEIVVLSREPYLPIDRPKLSKALKIDPAKIALRDADHFAKLGITFRISTVVKSVDTAAKSLKLVSGETINYNHLVLATGGDPRVIPVQGKDLANIFVLRDATDANRIDTALASVSEKSKPRVVIVGSSFIGMEAASILAKQATVTVVGMEKVPFERVLGVEVGTALKSLNESNGVILKMEAVIDHYLPSKTDAKRVGFVVLKNGEKIEADLVILGAGVVPQTSYLKDSGITLDRDGGITVQAGMQVPGIDDVYAVGDIARYPYHLTGELVRVEHWNVAQNQGRVAALNIIAKESGGGSSTVAFKQVPYFWTVQFGKSVRYAGHATSFDKVVVQGSTRLDASGAGISFAAFYFRKGVLVAVCSIAKDPVVSHVSELLRLGKAPTQAEIESDFNVLTIPLKSDEKYTPSVSKKITGSTSQTDEVDTSVLFWYLSAGVVAVLAIAIPVVIFTMKSHGQGR